jgi:hypothetical protein
MHVLSTDHDDEIRFFYTTANEAVAILQRMDAFFDLMKAHMPDIHCALFAHYDDLMTYVGHGAIAHIEEIRDQISPTRFSSTMQSLQNPNITNIYSVLKRAADLYMADHEPTVATKLKREIVLA